MESIDFQIYSNDNNQLGILVKSKDNEYGIKTVKYKNKDGKDIEINGNGKREIALDYEISKDGNYDFSMINNNGDTVTKTLNVNDNFRKTYSNFLCTRLLGILTAILFTITFFYTYTGIVGTNFAFVDISIFFAAVVLGEFVSYKILMSDFKCNSCIALFFITLLLICFITFTYFSPEIGLFKDPVSGNYGILK